MPRRAYFKAEARDRGIARSLHTDRKLFALPPAGDSSLSLAGASISARATYSTSALALIAILAGWLISAGNAAVVAAALLIAALLVFALRSPGPTAALLLLAVMNGLPVVDLSGRLPGGAHFQDGAVLALAALLYARRNALEPGPRTRLIRAASIWSACFIAFWGFTVARSWLLDGIPLLKAVLFGRDFLYFALLLPLALRADIPARSLRAGGWILLLGVILYAAATAVMSLTGLTLSWLVHSLQADPELGLTRVYSQMADLANTCLIFGSAFFLSRSARGHRWITGCLTLLLLLSSLLQLTRANYFGLAVAFLVGTYVFMAHYAAGGTFLVRAAVAILVLLTFVFSLGSVTGGTTAGGSGTTAGGSGTTAGSSGTTAGSAVTSVVSRLQTGPSDLSQSAGTVGYREGVDRVMLQVLGSRWPIGLGFLHPSARYLATPILPSGKVDTRFFAIRNADTGFFNILMTMGAIGLVLLFAPLIYASRHLLATARTSSQLTPARPPWIAYGGVAWIGWAIAGSPTLVVLFSVSGLVLAALVLASLAPAHIPGAQSGRAPLSPLPPAVHGQPNCT